MYWFHHPKIEYEEFKEKYPQGSDGYNSLMRIFAFNEMIGLLSKRELVDVELVYDMYAIQWDKFKPIVKGMQEDWGSTALCENYEWLGEAWQSIRNAQES